MMKVEPVFFKKFFLPVPLYEQFANFTQATWGVRPFDQNQFDLMNGFFKNFEKARIRLSPNIGDFKAFLNTAFSTRTVPYSFYFRKSDLMKINAIRYRFNIGPANAMKLIMCYYLYQSGDFCISPAELVSSFMLGQEYKYPVMLSREISDLYEHTMNRKNALCKTMFVRAAQFYYTNFFSGISELLEGPMFRVDNQCTGWKKFMIQGGPRFKEYISRMKKETGKPIGLIISNILYSFLNEYNGKRYEKT
jgi:hypothetical protein